MGLFGKKDKAEEEMKMRAQILRERLAHHPEIEEWMASSHDAFEAFGNLRLSTFFNEHFDGREVLKRFTLFNKHVENDQDHVRVHGQYYNNIYLGKRIFGPARKQVFAHSVVGGMERRFELIDSQVNHIPFPHEASDKYREKCRNPRIKCRDDTRVVLRFPAKEPHNFIHANRIAAPLLFNDFILTQAPLEGSVGDFWRMCWQERVRYIFMLIDRADPKRCAVYWPRRPEAGPLRVHGLSIVNEGVDDLREPHFRVTRLRIVDAQGTELRVEHWQGDLNNSDDLQTPLRLLRLARNCSFPTVVHDHLGVSRASALVAVELCIANLLKGPAYKYPVQRAVHFLRSFRPCSVETPMQYIFIHRVVQHFVQPFVGNAEAFQADYHRWLEERSQRLFVDDLYGEIPAYRLLSPKIDPDLLPLARRRERPEHRREIHSTVGELPLPVERPIVNQALVLPKRYPTGRRYN